MKLGMTGNRNGISECALSELKKFVETNNISEAHHGDCVGADTDFHNLCESFSIPIIIHPPDNNFHRSFCKSKSIRTPKPYLVRNHDIVDECDVLIAFPETKTEVIRSGTWSTVRYATKNNKKVIIIFPDGEIKKINYNNN
jgi:hypothetical protein